jgi:hypothetical protein
VPARPSLKGTFSAGKAFGSTKGKTESGARRETELSLTASLQNFEFYYPWGGRIS